MRATKVVRVKDIPGRIIYCRPDTFKIECSKCGSKDVDVTIRHFSKIEFVCSNCGNKEM